MSFSQNIRGLNASVQEVARSYGELTPVERARITEMTRNATRRRSGERGNAPQTENNRRQATSISPERASALQNLQSGLSQQWAGYTGTAQHLAQAGFVPRGTYSEVGPAQFEFTPIQIIAAFGIIAAILINKK